MKIKFIALGAFLAGLFLFGVAASVTKYDQLVATSFSGNGSALTTLNASALTSGTIPFARISASEASSADPALLVVHTDLTITTLVGTPGNVWGVGGEGATVEVDPSNLNVNSASTATFADSSGSALVWEAYRCANTNFANLAVATTVAVVFSSPMADANYGVTFGITTSAPAAAVSITATSKTVDGFTARLVGLAAGSIAFDYLATPYR